MANNKATKLNKMADEGINIAQFVNVDVSDTSKPKYIQIRTNVITDELNTKDAIL